VVGGGISGLATAWLLRDKARKAGVDVELTLLEKEDRIGGKILSIKADGYTCEWGPNGFLDSKPQTLELCSAIGVDGHLHRSNDNARKRFIYSGGELHRMPENGSSFLKSRLISWPGKLRLALEPTPFIAKAPQGVDETLAAFGRRRLGQEALDKLIAPMVSGIFAGDPETMSLISCFPRIAELEREYGGLVRAMIMLAKKKKKERAAGKAVSSAAGPGGVLTSFREGIQYLTDALAASLEDVVQPATRQSGDDGGEGTKRPLPGALRRWQRAGGGRGHRRRSRLCHGRYARGPGCGDFRRVAPDPLCHHDRDLFRLRARPRRPSPGRLRLPGPQERGAQHPGHPVGLQHVREPCAGGEGAPAQHDGRGQFPRVYQAERRRGGGTGQAGPQGPDGDRRRSVVRAHLPPRAGHPPVYGRSR